MAPGGCASQKGIESERKKNKKQYIRHVRAYKDGEKKRDENPVDLGGTDRTKGHARICIGRIPARESSSHGKCFQR